MATTPAASPSSPSTKFTAFTVTTTTRTVRAVRTQPDSRTMSPGPTGTTSSWTPKVAITTPARACPTSLVSASRPTRSSTTPTTVMITAASRIPTGPLSPSPKVPCRKGTVEASPSAAAKPVSRATPPSRGTGVECTSRSRTGLSARSRTATPRTGEVVRKVTTAATAITRR